MKRLIVLFVLFFSRSLAMAQPLPHKYVIPIDTRSNDVALTVIDAGAGAAFKFRFVDAAGRGELLGGMVGSPEETYSGDVYRGVAALAHYQRVDRTVRTIEAADGKPVAELQRFHGCLVIESTSPLVVETADIPNVIGYRGR